MYECYFFTFEISKLVCHESNRCEIFNWSLVAFNKGQNCQKLGGFCLTDSFASSIDFIFGTVEINATVLESHAFSSMASGRRNFSSDLRPLQGEGGRHVWDVEGSQGGKPDGGVTRINSSVTASLNLLCLASTKFVQVYFVDVH